mmetsp:Transcript_27483/g.65469  ORF Transcript_27483/g.65469 Transcript_27483/m.65469 type:complete len:516 (+) Transcript_27483:54-1601(+)|eukprot:CAMPEP_0180139724 /NCGR_PEP_ID=MMETSP0986-20121125/13733_1 /TAXON_ID=697907 /ORGANISM="non described non described, Strain CCMP2293" /LENGTH=515 /DNA_ID=CAMNT_0022081941 /DNA_START=54 /DNA_END=1601 /DNA_ORIENTATION=-
MADFGKKNAAKRQSGANGASGSALPNNKRSKINIYDAPPSDEVSMDEFEQFALDRMRVLKVIDQGKARGLKPDELHEAIKRSCDTYLPMRDRGKLGEFEEDKRKDQISHYILRMAYSRTEELRRWFLRQEEQLFKYRFSALDVEGRNHAMHLLSGREGDSALNSIDKQEYLQYAEQLDAVFGHAQVEEGDSGQILRAMPNKWDYIYKVPFEHVSDLLATRRVWLQMGEAYVVSRDIVSVVISNFRSRLSQQLTANARAFFAKAEEETERLGPLLQNLTNAYLGPNFSSAGAIAGKISLDKVPLAMNRSAPLCMKNLYDTLTSKHHLKHDGRMQFGLFLKGIGVTLEDSLTLWQEEMGRGGKTAEQFQKQYSYNIRHNYGVEGKRTNYTPYACVKIISGTPVADQAHGCPFKHWDQQHLTHALASMRIKGSEITEIVDKARSGHFQVACLKVFEATHGGATIDDGLNHPNQYFTDSIKHYAEKEGITPETPALTAPAGEAAEPTPTPAADTPMVEA